MSVVRLSLLLCALSLAGACGGDDDGGVCLGTDFDCEVVCANELALCDDCPDEVSDCGNPDCVTECGNVKGDPEAIPEQFRPLVLGEVNCLEQNDTCDGFTDCLRACLQ